MQSINFDEVVQSILAKDQRYHRDAYLFVREALEFTQKQIGKQNKNEIRHISGQELLSGLRDYGLSQFGPLTSTVLQEWGVHRCEDFGEIVFNMVEHGLLSKTDRDSRDDFKGGYDFHQAFCVPFLPASKKTARPVESQESSV